MGDNAGSARLAELAIALSLATDLGTGQPIEHGLRTCLLAVKTAAALELGDAARSCVYHVALLRFLGCTSDASQTASLGGGDAPSEVDEMVTKRINGVELYYEVTGSGDWLVLTHGSWTDGTSWDDAVARLSDRYRTVVWDRRGHSRSGDAGGAGSRAQDAADLAALIEEVRDGPVHAVGSSYGAIVTLTLLTIRPDLVLTAAGHEPPLFGLLRGTPDSALRAALTSHDAEIAVVEDLIRAGAHRAAAEHFIENVAFGPGVWEQLPEDLRSVFEANAPTFLDELCDPTALSIERAALMRSTSPVMLTHGTTSPRLFPAVITELQTLLTEAQVEVIEGAGHIPHATHTDLWASVLTRFHQQHRRNRAAAGS